MSKIPEPKSDVLFYKLPADREYSREELLEMLKVPPPEPLDVEGERESIIKYSKTVVEFTKHMQSKIENTMGSISGNEVYDWKNARSSCADVIWHAENVQAALENRGK